MTPVTPNQPCSKTLQQGQNQPLDVSPAKQDCPTLFNFLDQFQGNHDPKDHKLVPHNGGSSSSTNHLQLYNSSSGAAMVYQSIARDTNLSSSMEVEDRSKRNDKWVSSKARLMKMLMIPERNYGDINEDKAIVNTTASAAATTPSNEGIQNERYNQGSPTARVCTECQTTSTPLWRSGPVGPKTLCNACGIRQRKARRAAVEAVEADNSLVTSTRGHDKEKEEKLLVNKCTQFKKKKNTASTSTSAAATTTDSSLSEEMMERLDFFLTKVRKKSGFESTTEEVADTALLLMDISCGYVYP